MAWIKVQTTLARSAKMMQFAAVLRMRRREAVGVALDWFCWVDSQCANGYTGLLPEQVDEVMDCEHLADALLAVGWGFVGEDGFLYIADFEQHNGESAKARALAAERQARFKHGKGNAGSVTEVTQDALPNALPRERERNNNTVVGRSTGDIKADGTPAHPQVAEEDEGFRNWLAGLCSAHPSARKSRVLARDVMEAAESAYKRVPDAVRYVDLLSAYYASKKAVDSQKKAFYRPTGQRKFFEDLEDVLCHAERWQKEFGWGKKKETAERGKVMVTPGLYDQKRCAGVGPASSEVVTPSGYAVARSSETPLLGAEAMAFIRGETEELGV